MTTVNAYQCLKELDCRLGFLDLPDAQAQRLLASGEVQPLTDAEKISLNKSHPQSADEQRGINNEQFKP